MKRQQRSRYIGLYKSHKSMRKYECVYCFGPADTIDHVPPVSWVESFGARFAAEAGLKLLRVRSCRDCNGRLSNEPLLTVRERVDYLEGRI